jgi:short-subunit dehydrogenase
MTNKIVLITGAGSGLGRALASELNAQGYYIILAGRHLSILGETKSLLTDSKNSEILQLDLRNRDDIREKVNNILSRLQISCLINNAGVTAFKTIADTSEEETDNILQTNLSGAIFITKIVLPFMIEKREGKVVNILSVAANTIFKKSGVYAASKAGLLAFSNVLREEVREHNIRIINVLPGAIATPIWDNNSLEKFASRMMTPEDAASVIINNITPNNSAVSEEIVLRPTLGDL